VQQFDTAHCHKFYDHTTCQHCCQRDAGSVSINSVVCQVFVKLNEKEQAKKLKIAFQNWLTV
jgi:hypothetical protein